MKTYMKKCCMCQREMVCPVGFVGHNPEPLMPSCNDDGTPNDCCGDCNEHVLQPARMLIAARQRIAARKRTVEVL